MLDPGTPVAMEVGTLSLKLAQVHLLPAVGMALVAFTLLRPSPSTTRGLPACTDSEFPSFNPTY